MNTTRQMSEEELIPGMLTPPNTLGVSLYDYMAIRVSRDGKWWLPLAGNVPIKEKDFLLTYFYAVDEEVDDEVTETVRQWVIRWYRIHYPSKEDQFHRFDLEID